MVVWVRVVRLGADTFGVWLLAFAVVGWFCRFLGC